MSILLALETSGDVCSVAVTRDGHFLSEHTFRHGMHLSERLMGHIEAVLQEVDTTLDSVDVFAVGIGPGSFTGTRIGVMTFKTLASVTGKPLYGVDGMKALATEYTGLQETLVIPILPCRSGIVFAAVYQVQEATLLSFHEPSTLTIPELTSALSTLTSPHLLFCGPAASRYAEEIRSGLYESSALLSWGTALCPRASQVAHLAFLHHQQGDTPDDPLSLVPLYLAPPLISVPKTGILPS